MYVMTHNMMYVIIHHMMYVMIHNMMYVIIHHTKAMLALACEMWFTCTNAIKICKTPEMLTMS